jgi:hypothetical protein
VVAEQEEWDFYPCRVDDGPASISLNLSLIHQLDELPEDTLYAVRVAMAHPAEHGMGGDAEAEVMFPVEDEISDAARARGLRFIGRLRNNGGWQLTFMGAPQLEPQLHALAQAVLAPAGREFTLVSDHDPEWKYYTGFLYPEPERMRWIQDRRVVDVLRQRRDPLTTERRVDHWAYFPDERARSAFLTAVAARGFEPAVPASTEDNFAAHVHRVDPVELDHIHAVTTLLEGLAEEHGGEYDGWETSVQAPAPN